MNRQEEEQRQVLLSEFNKDPGRWRPLYYPTIISVPVEEGGLGVGQITLNYQSYIWKGLSHQIIGNTLDAETSGLYQDGQYTIQFQDEISNYQKEPMMAESFAGSVRSGFEQNLAMPIPFRGNRTLTFKIENMYTRILTPEAEYFKVALTMRGVADWGELMPDSLR